MTVNMNDSMTSQENSENFVVSRVEPIPLIVQTIFKIMLWELIYFYTFQNGMQNQMGFPQRYPFYDQNTNGQKTGTTSTVSSPSPLNNNGSIPNHQGQHQNGCLNL